MSQENVELSRAFMDGIARASQGGLDPDAMVSRMADFWDPEVEFDMSEGPALDIGELYRGIAACQQLWREWFSAWESLQFEYELVDAGSCVVVLIDLMVRGRSTGIEVPFGKHAFVTNFRDGLMFHTKIYMSQSEALEAAGVHE
jgi:SnoaL-like domain